jgi:hypothetical protein
MRVRSGFTAWLCLLFLGACSGGSNSTSDGAAHGNGASTSDGGSSSDGASGGDASIAPGDDGSVPDAAPAPFDVPPPMGAVTLSPHGLLLTKVGDDRVLKPMVSDVDGKPITAPVTWESSRPSEVSVDASGHVVALVVPGSALITAKSPGARDGTVLVMVAAPVDGAILIDDDQIIAGPELADPNPDNFGPGSLMTATLRGVPAPAMGALLLGRGDKPFGGRVQMVTMQGVDVVVQVALVSLGEAFHAIHVDVQGPLPDAPPDSISVTQQPQTIGSTTVMIGPFKCDASFMGNLISGSFTKQETDDLNFVTRLLKDEDGNWTEATAEMVGTVDVDLMGQLNLMAGFKGNLGCKLQLGEKQIPLPGIAGAAVGFQIPWGLKAELTGGVETIPFTLGAEVVGHASFTTGVSWTATGGPVEVNKFDHTFKLKPIYQPPGADFPLILDLAVGLGMYADLQFGAHAASGIRLTLLEAALMGRATAEIGSLRTQLGAPAFATTYQAKGTIEVKTGSTIAKLAQLGPSVSFLVKSVTIETPLKAASPTGAFSVDKTTVVPDEAVKLSVSLDQLKLQFFGIDNVTGVNFYHLAPGKSDPELWKTVSGGPGQTDYSTTWSGSVLDIGDHLFWAAAQTKVMPLVPVEVSVNTVQTVHLMRKGSTWSGMITFTATGMTVTGMPMMDGRTVTEMSSGTVMYTSMPLSAMDFQLIATGVMATVSKTVTTVTPVSYMEMRCSYAGTGTSVEEYTGNPSATAGEAGILRIDQGSGNYSILEGLPDFDAALTRTDSSSASSSSPDCPPENKTNVSHFPSSLTVDLPPISGMAGKANPSALKGSLSYDAPAGDPPLHYELSWDFALH